MRTLGAVVIGGYINGLGVVRALGARGIPVAVITTKPYDIAHRSRFVSSHEPAMEMEARPEQLIEILERRAPEWSGSAVFPTNDGALAALAEHRDRLPGYCLTSPPKQVAEYFLNKELMLQAADAVGMGLPHCYGPADQVTAALPDIRFPVIVKPAASYLFFSRFGVKLFTASNHAELTRCVARFDEANIRGQIFDLIPGTAEHIHAYCTYVTSAGESLGGVTIRKLRSSPSSFGVSRVAEIVDDIPVLIETTIALLRKIGHRGMAAAEFKLDPRDGKFRFLEINGRSILYNSLIRRAGFDMTGLAWSDFVESRTERPKLNGWRGSWINLHADVLYSMLAHRYEPMTFSQFIAPYLRPKIWGVESITDPKPAFLQWSHTVREGASTVFHGAYRKLIADRAGGA